MAPSPHIYTMNGLYIVVISSSPAADLELEAKPKVDYGSVHLVLQSYQPAEQQWGALLGSPPV